MNTRAAVSVRLLAYSASRARGPLLTAATVRAYHLSTFRTQAFSAAAAPRRILFAHPVPKHHVSGAREYSSNDKPSDVAESVKEQLGSVGADIFQLQHEHEEIAFIFRLFQSVLESLHDGALLGHAIPWWGVIAGSVVVLRLGVAFPAFVYQQRGLAKVRKLDKVVTAWTKTIAHSIKSENANAPLSETQFLQVLKRRMRLKRQELLVQHGCHPLFYVLMSISQLPIWVSMTFALRRLSRGFWWANTTAAASFSAAPGMSTEGVLWFTDLSAVDPTYILPACTGAVYMVNTVMAHRWNERASKENMLVDKQLAAANRPWYGKLLIAATFAAPFAIALFAARLPAAIPLYWVLSASFTTLQYTLRLNSRTRHFIMKR